MREIKFKFKPENFNIKIGFAQIFLFIILSLSLIFLPTKNFYKSSLLKNQPNITPLPTLTPTPIPTPVKKTNNLPPKLTAKAAIAVDVYSKAILYTKNEDLPFWPASTTKLMTALLVLDKYNLDDVVEVKEPISLGRVMDLVKGEKITVENLLYGLLIHSANDSAYVLANNYPGGFNEFIKEMNEKAKELNLENTHFVNPAGFDDNKQYTTASDLITLSLYALKNPTIAKMVGIPVITVSDIDFIYFHPLTNVNKLLGKVKGVAGVKTGWTKNAKENLVNLTKRNGNEVLTVVLGSDDRFNETEILTNWIFNNFNFPN